MEAADVQQPSLIPPWAWILIATCSMIPVLTIGGLIPSGLGIGGAFTVAAISRRQSLAAKQRVIYCIGITLVCWGLFGAFIGLAEKFWGVDILPREQQAAPATDISDEGKRREIFASAARALDDIDETQAKITEMRRRGENPRFYKRRLASLQESYQRNLEFAAKFHRIDRAELDAIVNEGIAENWPVN